MENAATLSALLMAEQLRTHNKEEASLAERSKGLEAEIAALKTAEKRLRERGNGVAK
jgi:hypothetical protein